ncbi:MAG: hypothetical protein ABIH59_01785 [archaeon]
MDEIKAHRTMNADHNWGNNIANTLYKFGVGLGLNERVMNEAFNGCNWMTAEAKAIYALGVASGLDVRALNDEYSPSRDGSLDGALRAFAVRYLIEKK